MPSSPFQRHCLFGLALLVLTVFPASAQRQMEKLGRGVVALHSATSQAYIGWRLFATDPSEIGFNVYRSANGGAGVKLNSQLLTNTTDYLDTTATFTVSNAWYVVPVLGGVEQTPSASVGLAANSPVRQYLPVALSPVIGGMSPPYDVKFCWVGDFDGDGEYDYLVDRLTKTGTNLLNQYLQAYKRDGTFLWQMDMGYNSTNQYTIEPGASAISVGHGDNVTVYDLDGDNKAEVIVRTAKGVVFADGSVLTNAPDNTTQYLSIIDGLTGAEKARALVPNPFPSDGPLNGHMAVFYPDGVQPSVVLAAKNRRADNGFQGLVTVWDYRNGALTQRWSWNDQSYHQPEGHQIRLGDPSHDGKDEFIDIGYTLNSSGTPLFNVPEITHGDRFHLTDIDPDRPGLEMFIIQQNNPSLLATALYDPSNGKMLKKWYSGSVTDVGRGVVGDLDPAYKGCEFFSTQPGVFDRKASQIYYYHPFPPEAIWWDTDLGREFVATIGSTAESPGIDKFNPSNPGTNSRIYTIYSEGVHQAYGGRPAFTGDLLGDWREELVLVANDYSEIRIYATKLLATNRLYCLMQNPQYRDQTTTKGYVQSSYVDYYLGNQMEPPAPPPVSDARLVWRGNTDTNWDANSTANWFTNNLWISNFTATVFNPGDTVLFDLTGSNSAPINLTSSLQPGWVMVHSPKNYTFSGSGSLDGAMKLTKAGGGKLTFNGTNNYTGKTLVAEGSLVINGSLPSSPVTVRGGVWLDGRLGGTGVVGSPVVCEPGGGISPGAGTNAPGTLTIANQLSLRNALNDFDLSDDASGTTKTNDLLVVTGNLTLQGVSTLVIRALNPNLPPGAVYPLINYSGTLSGGLTNLTVSGPLGIPLALTNPPGQIALVVKSYRAPATISWTGGQGGNAWDLLTSSNWLNGAAKDQFAPGDAVRFDNIGTSNLTANLSGDLTAASIIVDSTANYTLAGSGGIIGSAGLTKTNSGTLTISALNNAFTGRTVIAGGMVVVGELDAIGFPSPLGNPPGTSPTNLVLSGNSTLRITGESYTERGLTLNPGTNTIDVFNAVDQVTIAGQVVGTGTLLKAGAGNLALTVANTYSGNTIINAGSISLGSVAGNQTGIGTGSVTFNNGTLSMINLQASETAAWNIIVPTNGVGRVDADGRCTLTGSLTGGGTFTVFTPYVRTDLNGNWSAFTGQINAITDADGGSFRCNNSAGYPNAKLNLASGVSLQNRVDAGTPTIAIGELSGGSGAGISGGTGNDGLDVNWSVGGLNTSATFAGNTYNNVGFIKVGTGTWTLSGTNLTHTGPTTVNGGTLLYTGTGSNSTSVVTVGAAGLLGGTGIIGGNLTVNGKLAPGISLGTLTGKGSLTFGAGGAAVMEIRKSPLGQDLAAVAGTVTYGGTLIVTNLAGTLTNGDSFKIFDAAAYAGSFASYALPPLGAGLAWNTSALNTSGTLSVVNTNTVPPPAAPSGLIATAGSSSQINLTWTDTATNESNFLVERSADNVSFTQIISVGTGVTNTADTGLAASTLYYYRVRAANSGGNSAYSAVASATTLVAPTGLVWRGDGVANAWDLGVSSNWVNAGNSATFANGASVLFDDTGSNNVPVNVTSALQPASINVSATKNYTFNGAGGISGSTTLNKSGSGSLTISTTNTFSGGITISNGSIIMGNIEVNRSGFGTGTITFMGGTLQFNGYGGNVGTGWSGSTNTLNVPAGQTGTLLLPPRWGYSAPFTSPLTGGGTLNVTVDYVRDYFSGNWSAFTGQINVSPRNSTGDFRVDHPAGYANAAMFLNNGVTFYVINNNNLTVDIGELAGASGAQIIPQPASSGGTPNSFTLRVGGRNSDATFAGRIADNTGVVTLTKIGGGTWTLTGTNANSGVTTISGGTLQIGENGTTGIIGTNNVVNNGALAFNRSDAISDSGVISGPGSLAQIGDGTLTLNNAHTYTGATIIDSGTLALAGNGAIASSTNINISEGALLDVSARTGGAMTLTTGKTLSGNGAVKGNFTIASGAKLSPGNSLGTLTFTNALTLAAGSSTKLEITKAPLTNDVLSVLGNLTYGGALAVTNISGLALAAGDSFPLLNAATHAGSFSSLTLPALGVNLAWDTNNFLTSGTLTVISTAPPVFGAITTLGDGNFRLIFSGPTGRDYELRATTNLSLVPVTLWELLDNDTFGNTPMIYDDLSATNYPQRFYQIRVP